MKKRMLSALLALSMLCSALPAPAFAQGADSAGLNRSSAPVPSAVQRME